MIGLAMLLAAAQNSPHYFGVSDPQMAPAAVDVGKRCGINLTARPWKEGDFKPEPTADLSGWQIIFSDEELKPGDPRGKCYIRKIEAIARDLRKKGQDIRVLPNPAGQAPPQPPSAK